MKRFMICFSLLLIMALLLSTAVCVSAEDGYIRGDADGNGQVNIIDATVIQRALAELPVKNINRQAADSNGNGMDITDATRIQRYIAHFADPYGIGEFVSSTQPTKDPYELPFIPIG